MADEQYRWLDRETAERLLRGESLEAVEQSHRDQAEQLAKTLEALTAEPSLSSAELPGEAAALAAFRTARAHREEASATAGEGAGSPAARAADVGLVRLGVPGRTARRPRWSRPLRLGLAATLTVGMVGGVAVAAGTGVLRTPFGSQEPGRPAATTSAEVPTERPLVLPPPETGAQDEPTPDGTAKGPTGPGASRDTASGGATTDRGTPGADRGNPGAGWSQAVNACRDVRDRKELSRERLRALERVAGSSAQVWTYCKTVLTGAGESTRAQGDERRGEDGQGEDKGRGKGDDDGKGDDGKGDGGRGSGAGHGNGHRTNSAAHLLSDVRSSLTVVTRG